MSQPEHRIEVDGVWKVFGDGPERVYQPEYASMSRAKIQAELGVVVALRDVSFTVDAGETFVVMGLSGSGKSTLVRCLIRLIEATSGQVRFDGEDINAYSPAELMQFPPDQGCYGLPTLCAPSSPARAGQRGVRP